VIRPSQSALGRNILEGVVVLHETIHELHRKKMDGVLFKIDFKKAYNKVKWLMTLSKCAKLRLQVQSVVARVNFPHEGNRGLYQTLGE
jgi:hypothetical protein